MAAQYQNCGDGPRCSFYLLTKHRCCRFPVAGLHGFCIVHAPTVGLSHGTAQPQQRIPCPVDPSHSIYRSRIIGHLRGCTRTRDQAWELSQPFCQESVNDPHGNCDNKGTLSDVGQQNEDGSEHDLGQEIGSESERDLGQDNGIRSERDFGKETSVGHERSNVTDEQSMIFRERVLSLGLSLNDFIEQKRVTQNCNMYNGKDGDNITLVRIASRYNLLKHFSNNNKELNTLNDQVNRIYQYCCDYLEVDSQYYLEGIIDGCYLEEISYNSDNEKRRHYDDNNHNTNSDSDEVLSSSLGICIGEEEEVILSDSSELISGIGGNDATQGLGNHSLEASRRIILGKYERNNPDDEIQKVEHSTAKDFWKSGRVLPFPHAWGNSFEKKEFFREIVRSGVKEANKKREQRDATMLISCTPSTPECDAPPMNKHEFQNASLLGLCLLLGYVDPSRIPTIALELGAGRGALTRWFVLASILADKLNNRSENSAKFVLIDREKRRNITEGKDESLLLDKEMTDASILRLRLDIRDFDYRGFLNLLLGHSDRLDRIERIPRLFQFLGLFGAYPFNLKKMKQVASKCQDSSQEDSKSDVAASIQNGRKKLPEKSPKGCPDIRNQLLVLARGGGVPIEKIMHQIEMHFTPKWIDHQTSNKQENENRFLNIISFAKHLCGVATDASLRAVFNGLHSLQSQSAIDDNAGLKSIQIQYSFAIAPCCHHRCQWNTALGQEFLLNLGINQDDFSVLVSTSGWGTGATGLKQSIGIKAKRIIDTARIFWLREKGFQDASLIRFVSGKPTTLENVVIVGKQVVHTHFNTQPSSSIQF